MVLALLALCPREEFECNSFASFLKYEPKPCVRFLTQLETLRWVGIQ